MAHPEESSPEIPSAGSPEIDLTIDGERYTLTWHNTLVKKFLVGEGAYDHLLHQLPDGKCLFIHLDGKVGMEVRNLLEENSYPHRVDPLVDDETVELLVREQTANLDEEIKREFS